MRADLLAAINSVALAIGRFSTLFEMLDYALARVLEVVESDAASVYLLDEDRNELSMKIHRGLSDAAWKDFDHLRLGEGLSGRVVVTGEPIVVRSLKDDPRLTRMAARLEGFRAFASIPLRFSLKTYGTLNVYSCKDYGFSEEEVHLLTSMASQIGLAVANARLYLELQASERKFRGLVENAEDLIYLTDRVGSVTYANPALQRLLRYDPASVRADGCSVLSLVDPADRPALEQALLRMLAGEVFPALEFRMRSADGAAIRWFSQTNVPLRDETGLVTGLQCIAHDITERREMHMQMAEADRLAALGRMAAGVAHEIRNPLGAIVNSINILRRFKSAEEHDLLNIVTEEVGRLNGIIGEFLMFARPPKVSAVPCDIQELIESTVTLFRRGRKENSSVALRINISSALPCVSADPNQMRQVLWNLLDNAVDASDERGASGVDVDVMTAGGEAPEVTIAITDDGPGILDIGSVFEPFVTTKAQGTGLGLAVVARIIREHGGIVRAENVANRGARFSVTLPAAATRGVEQGA